MNIILHKLNSLLCIQNNTAILWRHQFSVFLILGSVLCTLHSLNALKINEIDSFLTFRQFSVLPFLFSVFLDRQAPSIFSVLPFYLAVKFHLTGLMKKLKFLFHYQFSLSIQH